jgi:hypothetical protein
MGFMDADMYGDCDEDCNEQCPGIHLTREAMVIIVSKACEAAGKRGQTREELERVVDWASSAIADYAVLCSVLKKEVAAYIQDGEDEICFKVLKGAV